MPQSHVPLFCCYDGKWIRDGRSFFYEGGKSKVISVSRDITYELLLSRVYRLTNSRPENVDIRIRCLFPTPIPMPPSDITDDEDLASFFLQNERAQQIYMQLFITKVIKSAQKTLDTTFSQPNATKSAIREIEPTIEPLLKLVTEHEPVRLQESIEGVNQYVTTMPNTFVDYVDNNGGDDYHVDECDTEVEDVGGDHDDLNGNANSDDSEEHFPIREANVDVQTCPIVSDIPRVDISGSSTTAFRRFSPVKDYRPTSYTLEFRDASVDPYAAPNSDIHSVPTSSKEDNYVNVDNSRFESVLEDTREILLGQMFKDKSKLQNALYKFAMRSNFQFKVVDSNKTKYTVKCLIKNCTWKLRASKVNGSQVFKIKTYTPQHSCALPLGVGNHRQATSSVVSDMIVRRIEGRMSYKPKEIIDDVWQEYGVKISYKKAWKAREMAIARCKK